MATALGVNCVFDDSRTPQAALDPVGRPRRWRLVDGAADAMVLGGDDGCIGIGHSPTFAARDRAWLDCGPHAPRQRRRRGHPARPQPCRPRADLLAAGGRCHGARAGRHLRVVRRLDDAADRRSDVVRDHAASWRRSPRMRTVVLCLPVSVPSSTAVAGLRLASQAFALDPAMPFGFVANAVRACISKRGSPWQQRGTRRRGMMRGRCPNPPLPRPTPASGSSTSSV